ncbi:MAG: hydrogenase maturation nickel metallochaperone HypA [Myxococcaceae bacterium]|jgi:hydrogenase nickel incorporation protein HypA/HybF|nr:hydrogenase maturation nickel metallochaperone HypA [Myxococcaceae bacterium]
MHEVALAQSIVDIVREQTKGQTFGAVTRVFLRIGALSSVEPEALVFGFDSAARGTVADGARLEIVRTPGTAFCAACGRDVQVAARIDDCPACGSAQLLITGGDELRVTELEVA